MALDFVDPKLVRLQFSGAIQKILKSGKEMEEG